MRLIAFNLAQERQILTDDAFNESGFVPLSRTLTKLDLATIPYQAIEPGAMEHFLFCDRSDASLALCMTQAK